jgi:hypothetical protein
MLRFKMNNQSSDSQNSQHDVDPLAPVQPLVGDALARRRLLLKGATGGASALAALTPVGAMAQSTVFVCGPNAQTVCSLSGTNSAAHSFGPNVSKVVAGGRPVAYWGKPSSTSPMVPANTWPTDGTAFGPAMKLSDSFLGVNSTTKLCKVLADSPGSPEAHWITAYLNALKYQPLGTFPYTAAQVKGFYADSLKRDSAVAFFTNYLENLPAA